MNNNEKSRRMRKTKDVSQKVMAIELGISQSAVSKLERGHVKMTETKMKELADCLGVTPDEIKEFGNKSVSINIEGDNSGSNIGIIINELKGTYEQLIQDKERIIESKDVIISLLQAKIIELLEKEK